MNKFGGNYNGYFLPSEGTNNVALALFTFPSLAEYERYRTDSFKDPECTAAFKFAEIPNVSSVTSAAFLACF